MSRSIQIKAVLAVLFTVACLTGLAGLFRLGVKRSIQARLEGHLRNMTGYEGHMDGIGLSVWRGAYQIEGLKITQIGGPSPIPFFYAPVIDIGLQWPNALKGSFVACVVVEDGRLNFVGGPSRQQSQAGLGVDWLTILSSLAPVRINQFRLQGGEIHFSDPYGKPPVDMKMEEVQLKAEHLYELAAGSNKLPGSVLAGARMMNAGRLTLDARFDPRAPSPAFDYRADLGGLELTQLNPLFQRYAGMQVLVGTADVHSEGTGAGGAFKGYIQPKIRGLELKRDGFSPKRLIQKAILGVLVWAFTDPKSKNVEAKFEFSGAFKDPGTSIWTAPAYIFEHGFVNAFPHGLAGAAMMEGLKTEAGK